MERLNERNKRKRSTGALKIIIKPFLECAQKMSRMVRMSFFNLRRRSLGGKKMVKIATHTSKLAVLKVELYI